MKETKTKTMKRGAIYWNTATNRAERVVTVTATEVGTKAGKDAAIEIHSCDSFRRPSDDEIRDFLGFEGRFAKSAIMISDSDSTAIAYGDSVVVITNTSPALPKIKEAVVKGNMRSLAQYVSKKRLTK